MQPGECIVTNQFSQPGILELVESPKTPSSAQEAAPCLIFANVEMGRGRQ